MASLVATAAPTATEITRIRRPVRARIIDLVRKDWEGVPWAISILKLAGDFWRNKKLCIHAGTICS